MTEYVLSPSADNARAVREAAAFCKANGVKKLRLTPGTYEFYPQTADEELCCISNHGHNGCKRAAFVIRGMKDLEVDGGGSLLVFHGAMTPVIVHDSENITLRNFRVHFPMTNHCQFRVTKVGENYCDLTVCTEQSYRISWGLLWLVNEDGLWNVVYSSVERDGLTFERSAGEQSFGTDFPKLKTVEVSPGTLRVYDPPRLPKKGNTVILLAAERYGCGVLFLDSKNVRAENVTLYSCYGVGFHGQKCENVTLENCRTEAFPGNEHYAARSFSVNCDASHFVGCTGLVHLKGCSFRHQLDDSVNVHGVYTKVIAKDDTSITVCYVHEQCRGVGLFADGCDIAALNAKTLLPHAERKVSRAEVLNVESTHLTLEGGTDGIEVGDVIDSLSFYPDVLIEDCVFADHRARGILMGSRGKVVIRRNVFHTAGTAIRLESDGNYWYEAGGVCDLTIEDNRFDDCRYIGANSWGRRVIEVKPRDETVEGRYYHQKVVIRNNDFSTCRVPAADLNNIETLVFTGNRLNGTADELIRTDHCKTVDCRDNG